MLYYVEASGNWLTLEALVYGLVLGAVMFIVIQWFSCYNCVMTTDKFVYLFGRLIPALSLVLSMALRFVPRFTEQLRVIRNGQKAMGRDVTNGSMLAKAKHGMNILSILVTWALENAIETSDSMRSRGYGLHGRTAFSIYRYTKRDRWLTGAFAILAAVFAFGCVKGAAFAVYDPKIQLAGINHAYSGCGPVLAVITYLAFAVFCFLPVFLNLAERAALARSQKAVGTEIGYTYRKIYEELEQEKQYS